MRHNKIYQISPVLIIIILLLNSCDPFFNCLDGNGILKKEQRFLSAFYQVENITEVNVKITADSVYSLEVIADENLISSIQTTVSSNDKLTISLAKDRCINTDNEMIVDIHMPILERIISSGSGNIDVYDFDCGNLEITNSGSGKIDIVNLFSTKTVEINLYGSGNIFVDGKAREGDYTLTGSGDILADYLTLDKCKVTNSGSGNVYCFAYDELIATLTGSGDIIYSGNPPVKDLDDDYGSGEIRSRN